MHTLLANQDQRQDIPQVYASTLTPQLPEVRHLVRYLCRLEHNGGTADGNKSALRNANREPPM